MTITKEEYNTVISVLFHDCLAAWGCRHVCILGGRNEKGSWFPKEEREEGMVYSTLMDCMYDAYDTVYKTLAASALKSRRIIFPCL